MMFRVLKKFVFWKAQRLFLFFRQKWWCLSIYSSVSLLEGEQEDRCMHFLPKHLDFCLSAFSTS